MTSLLDALRKLNIMFATVASNGTVSNAYGGLVNGTTGVGSCTLSDTSLFTFAWPIAFKRVPMMLVFPITTNNIIANSVGVPSTTAGVVRTSQANDGTTKTAAAFLIVVIGERPGL